ncbi:MAG: hypothetical protein E7465_04930 [Ruminococcaceae bacterium]|nr:hypothetical protein [Oscillospiraceae bacterium]
MQNNPKNFEDAMRIARSPAGQELFRLLQSADQEKLNKAMSGAASGDYEAVKNSLGPLLSSPEVRALLAQMGGYHGSNGR